MTYSPISRPLTLSSLAASAFFAALAFAATPSNAYAPGEVPAYRVAAKVKPSRTVREKLKVAARYGSQPGAVLQAAKGPLHARIIILNQSDPIIVFTNLGKNGPSEAANAARTQTVCFVPQQALYESFSDGGMFKRGYAMPCSSRR